MQHTNTHAGIPWQSSRLLLPTTTTKLMGVLSVVIGFVLVVTFVLVWMAPAISLDTLFNHSQLSLGNALGLSATDRKEDLANFEQNARNLADSNSPEAFQMLLQSLKQSEPLSQRGIVLMALKDASPSVVPALMTALNDADRGVRTGAAQVLGMRREHQAIAALNEATRDPDAGVRREAVTSLGVLDARQVLPRLEQLQVNEPNADVRQAASAAKQAFSQKIAQEIGVPISELRDISVTAGDVPQIYAATTSNLYARHGTAWTLVSRLPDAPLAITTGSDPALIYLATVGSGLYRSLDGGETWEHVQFGLETPTQLTVTAVVVDPQGSRQVYIALAAQGAKPGVKDPMGIVASKDSGATWWALENSPTGLITTRLVIDPQERGYLFGMTSDTPWRYALPD